MAAVFLYVRSVPLNNFVSVVDITDSNASVDDAVVMETDYLPFGSELISVNFV